MSIRNEIPSATLDSAPSAGAPPGEALIPVVAGLRRLPIGHRLPNPPALFLGRGNEISTAMRVLDNSRVLAITGDPGIGKTAFALKVIEAFRPQWGDGSWGTIVNLNSQPRGRMIPELLELLGRAQAVPPDWRVVGTDRQMALATLIDIADLGRWIVLLDDADLADPVELAELLVSVRDYSRSSRWLLTSRKMVSSLIGEVPRIQLSELPAPEMLEMASNIAMELRKGDLESLVARAEGNPRRLLAAASNCDQRQQDEDVFLAVMASLDRPVRVETLSQISRLPSESTLKALYARGVLLKLPNGLWLRRDDGQQTASGNGVSTAQLAAELEIPDDDSARLEAVRLWLVAGNVERAKELLGRFAESMCENGLAPDLWDLLSRDHLLGSTRDEFKRWRQWAAFEWGDPETSADLKGIEADTGSDYLGAHLRARVQIARGDFEAAVESARVSAAAASTAVQHDRAVCRGARALVSLGKWREVLELVDSCRIPSGEIWVEQQVARGEALVSLGEASRANEVADSLVSAIETLGPNGRMRALLGVARIRMLSQRSAEAEAALDLLLAMRAERGADAVSARTALEMHAAIATQRARFPLIRELANRLLPYERAYPVRALFVRSYLLTADAWQRPTAEFTQHARRLLADAFASESSIARDVGCYTQSLLALAESAAGMKPDESLTRTLAQAPIAYHLASRDAVISTHLARWGLAPLVPVSAASGAAEHQILFAIAHAAWELNQGHEPKARELLESASTQARAEQLALMELIATRVSTLLAIHAGDVRELNKELSHLVELGQRVDSTLLRAEAEFFERLVGSQLPYESFEAWAADEASFAGRMRWSRWMLGATLGLDPLEDKVFTRCALQLGWHRPVTIGAGEIGGPDAEWKQALGIDGVRRVVWSATGVVADLSKNDVLWAILRTLADNGGEASKEVLVVSVWQVVEYHPLHHDNRLRVAVRKLRQQLGEHAEAALDTTDDGYALTGTWRWVAAQAPSGRRL